MEIVDSGRAKTRNGEYYWHRMRTPLFETRTYSGSEQKNSDPKAFAALLEKVRALFDEHKH